MSEHAFEVMPGQKVRAWATTTWREVGKPIAVVRLDITHDGGRDKPVITSWDIEYAEKLVAIMQCAIRDAREMARVRDI